MNVLVTGGAGYIGSHAVRALIEAGHTPIVLDSLEHGHAASVGEAELILGNVLDHELVARACRQFSIEAVMHFAAYIEVGESMVDPIKYYANNTMSVLSLLKTMQENGVGKFIFSSTAATYGQSEKVPIAEDAPLAPINVYGHSKLIVEQVCSWLARQTEFGFIALRYFNAGGAHPDGTIGEDHNPESHLIPLVFQTALGKRKSISIFGDDYDTPDGTCVRDYIHVWDLAKAHVKAMEHLANGGASGAFNLGAGNGHSVREIIECARRASGAAIPAEIKPRRAGDPAVLVADPGRAFETFNWRPEISDLKSIVGSAWQWHSTHPDGYADAEL
ncbi:MAG: UDP-glucose 4-epimerase GalE [Planctomycetota bacterium]|jgi:UDP-glucose 4-epimerase|nr:UDP-glucose 4-epimerase GalE [Planctomycetota bacterium]